jgi:thiosulfate/3-mercaptopyruvate sulfurtransferase
MNQALNPIINANELLKLYTSSEIIMLDASNGPNALKNYENKHLKSATHIDLNTQLSDKKEYFADGGRHPLPNIEAFVRTLGELGINNNSHVVIYDDNFGSNAASRLWWMLHTIRHQKVQVLNGGLAEAEKVNFPVSSGIEKVSKTQIYQLSHSWEDYIVNMVDVEAARLNDNYVVIDVRITERYDGKVEPIDPIAGHIPGAINIPLSENLDGNGCFLPSSDLALKYQKYIEDKPIENIIVHCGSGVTACHTLLAFNYAGLGLPKLYVGSWSEWCRNNNPIGTNI